MDLSLKYGGILLLTFSWWRMLAKLIASMPLLTNDSGRNERFSSSWFLTQTGLNGLWKPISKIMAKNLYNDEVGSEKGASRLVLYRECSRVREFGSNVMKCKRFLYEDISFFANNLTVDLSWWRKKKKFNSNFISS